jgi:hypothetical protein
VVGEWKETCAHPFWDWVGAEKPRGSNRHELDSGGNGELLSVQWKNEHKTKVGVE